VRKFRRDSRDKFLFIAHGIEGLLGARLCHDLACPVSAANNGTELDLIGLKERNALS